MRYIEDVCWRDLFGENDGLAIGLSSFYLDDVRWSRLFKAQEDPGPEIYGEYGVEWDYSSPSPALTRTGDSVGFVDPVPATTLTDVGSSPFDDIMPWAGMKMCNIIDGEVAYWQGDPQFSETDYDTMVYIPEFWYKAEKHTDTRKWSWSISPSEKDGYAKHPGSGRYISRYHSSGSSVGVFSKSDTFPLVSTSRPNFRVYSHNKGNRWWMIDIATWSALQMLYLVEYANFDSQAKLGEGQSSGSITSSGGTTGAKYHTLRRSNDSNQYRWVENPYSNVRTWIDGVVSVNKAVYVGLNNSSFSDNSSSLTKANLTVASGRSISGFGYSSICPYAFIPDTASSEDNVYVTDRVYSATETRALYVGGTFASSWVAGMFYFNLGVDASASTNANLGSRLIFIP